jgi:hypothetical protein
MARDVIAGGSFELTGSYKVKADTPWGTLTLWPYEYAVKDPKVIIELWRDGAMVFHPTNTSLAHFNAVVFYVRSRGIELADAMVMALGTITGNVGWFEPATPELAAWMEDMAERIHEQGMSVD